MYAAYLLGVSKGQQIGHSDSVDHIRTAAITLKVADSMVALLFSRLQDLKM